MLSPITYPNSAKVKWSLWVGMPRYVTVLP